MDRLRILALLSAFTLSVWCARPVPAQISDVPPAPCLVIGDVARPDAYPVTPGANSVGQIVDAAGLSAPSGSVTVLRQGTSLNHWTEFVQRGVSADSSPVQAGDILIVRCAAPADSQVTPSAALLANGVSLVLTLSDTAITTADVLSQCRVSVPAGFAVVRLAGSPGEAGQPIAAHDIVRHGDVLSIAQAPAHAAARSGVLNTRVTDSVFPDSAPSVSFPGEGLRTVSQSSDWSDERGQPADNGPSVITVPTQLPQAAATRANGGPWLLPQDAQEDLHAQAAPLDPFVEVSAGPTATGPEQDRGQATAAADAEPVGADLDTASVVVAPLPPEESTASTGGFGLMNALFISAMLLAGSLIIAGWVRSELAGNRREAAALVTRRSLSTDAPKSGEPNTGTTGKTSSATGLGRFQDILQHPIDAVRRTAPSQPTATAPAATSSPTPSQLRFAAAVSNEHAALIPVLQPSVAVSPSTTELVRKEEFFGDWRDLRRSGQGTTRSTPVAAGARQPIPARPAPEASPTPERGPEDSDALEALIQNRLPVDLCRADLPLKIALYGRPAGPRRLRVDAAHEQLPAPHFSTSPQRQQRDSSGEASGNVSATAAESGIQPASETPAGATASNSLDRALNYLNERVNS